MISKQTLIPQAILFDLDGTLLDTVPDLAFALNVMRQEKGLLDIPDSLIRPIANLGSKAMIQRAFDINDTHPELPQLREKFLAVYHQHLANATRLFPDIDKVLNHLDQHNIPWGIVTNKPSKHTHSLLEQLQLAHRPHVVVCGDTLAKAKPYPDPIFYACKQLNLQPETCLFIGDAATDVAASKAAGMKSLVALYGYINSDEDPYGWQADGYIYEPIEILDYLQALPSTNHSS